MLSSDPTQEKAPDAAATAVRRIDLTQEGEITMNTTASIAIHPGIEAVFDEMDRLQPGYFLKLDDTDFAFASHGDEWTRPVSDFRIPLDAIRADLENGTAHQFGRWYRANGALIPNVERSDEWMQGELEGITQTVRGTTNAAWRTTSGHLFVSDGVWMPVEETTLGGEPAFTFVTLDEVVRRAAASRAAAKYQFITAHAHEIESLRPAWALTFDVYGLEFDDPEVYFVAAFDGVEITAIADLGRAVVSAPTIAILSEKREDLTPTEALALSASLTAAAEVTSNAEVSA